MTDLYTPYALYQDKNFPETTAARTPAYTSKEYQCSHSQQNPAYMFEDPAQKQFYDAAYSSCCNQPITPLAQNPQYTAAGEYRPPIPADCGGRDEPAGCNALEISATGGVPAFCADMVSPVEMRAICPHRCADLQGIMTGETLEGQYGSWSYSYPESQEAVLLNYTPFATLVQDHYDKCLGVTSYQEVICDDYGIEFELSAGLNSPNGCRCDCCGNNGQYTPPNPAIHSSAPAATYENTVSWNPVYIEGACYDGYLDGTVYDFLGYAGPIAWSEGPEYESDGSYRRVRGVPFPVGSASTPACCGVQLNVGGYDGCSQYRNGTVTVPRKPPSPSWSPSGDTLQVGQAYTIRVIGACNKSSLASLELDSLGVDTTNWGSNNFTVPGELRRNINTATLSDDFPSKGCCGKGEIAAAYNDGCNNPGTHQWHVRNQASPNVKVGTLFKASNATGTWRVHYKDLMCSGSEGVGEWSAGWYGGASFATQSLCEAWMADPANFTGACGSGAFCPTAGQCCLYLNNGTQMPFRAAVFCVNNDTWETVQKCCQLPFSDNSQPYHAVGVETCCPN